MRVAFLSVSDQMGGSEAVLLEILGQLRRSRPSWPLHLVLPGTGPLADRAAALDVRVVPLPMPSSLSRLGDWGLTGRRSVAVAVKVLRAAADLPAYERRLRELLSAIGPDVLHTNGFKAHIVGARARCLGRGLVWHMHEYVGRRPMTRTLVRRYARRASVIIANSESVAVDVREIAGADVPVVVIHNAVDLVRFSPTGPLIDLDARCGLDPAPAGTVRVGLVATFSRWKGHETFLRALAALPPALPVRGYVVGGALYDTDGSQHSAAELTGLAASLGLKGRVGFAGFVDGVDAAMRALDVVVHASTAPEPFGLVIAEAMACGRAVITSGTGGASELVRDGVDAVTHQPADPADLALGIERLAADAPLRARLGRAARETAERRFNAGRFAEEFARLYEAAKAGSAETVQGGERERSR
jgi:glycosyltransferase involved in cell wall biosynthesis